MNSEQPRNVSASISDVVVVGAGVIGLATARALLKAGASVTVLEQNRVGRGSASWAAGGILAPLEPGVLGDSQWPVLRRSLALQATWNAELLGETGIDPEYESPGIEVLSPFELEAWTALAERVGFSWESESYLNQTDSYSVKLKLNRVAHVRPPRLLRALAASVRRLGGTIIENARVSDIRSASALHYSGGRLSTGVIVLAAGAWSGHLLPGLGVEPVRGQMLLLQGQPGELGPMKLQQGMYLLQRRDGSIVAGSTLESSGFDDRCTDQGQDEILEAVRRITPELAGRRILHRWAGLRPRPQGPDLHLGWAEQRDDLYLCTGHHRLGITLAPGSAEIASQAILGRA